MPDDPLVMYFYTDVREQTAIGVNKSLLSYCTVTTCVTQAGILKIAENKTIRTT